LNTVIKVDNISKQYRLGLVGTNTIADDLKRFWAKVRGQEDPALKVDHANILSSKENYKNLDYIWALKDISFTVKQGEVLGIIGKNGAGKSTLLKILSKVTSPSSGSVKVKGRIASLLEVGTGFHPELTGRENVFLNGAILGMTKLEIKKKFDEIVEFSGVNRYIDTPVKRYSSGMYVRLAFAVAAHLEPEILIVDEVLAVGDAEFQKKCLGKMKDVSSHGRTVIFVSHNIGAINSLCNSCILLSEGKLIIHNKTEVVTTEYFLRTYGSKENINLFQKEFTRRTNIVSLNSARIIDKKNELQKKILKVTESFGIEIDFEILESGFKPVPQIVVESSKGEIVFVTSNYILHEYSKGIYKSIVWFPENLFSPGIYYFNINIVDMYPTRIHLGELGFVLEFLDDYNALSRAGYKGDIPGLVRPLLKWENAS
jgi:lipopolysaccharide transport system ATP-binding protein